MGDVGEFYRDTKELRKEISNEKKSKNYDNAIKLLDKEAIPYDEKNGGIHLVVDGRFDYYPTTGKFISRKTKTHGRGIFNLIKKVKE